MQHAPLHDLLSLFELINRDHFDGFLEAPVLRWNPRLRSSAGRFIPGTRPGSRRFFHPVSPAIEIASYLVTEERAAELIADTLAHEMIHYWLWVRRKPYGHTAEFHSKMNLMGVSRYNPVPRSRPYKYVYLCGTCETEFPARRKLGPLACAKCCRKHSGGRYDARFKLMLHRHIARGESYQPSSRVREKDPSV